MERDVRGNPPELRPRAEALLLERDPTGLRAGAVELLPDDASARVRQLLRGLLATVRAGRWRWPQIEAWLRGKNPPDRYDLPRHTHLFVREQQSFTLAELAELYAQPQAFAEGVAELFPEEESGESVWCTLQEEPQYRAEHERLKPLREMVDMTPWQSQPRPLRQAAVAAVIWATLADPARRRPLPTGSMRQGCGKC
jgi:hypothetical protein